VHVQLPAVGLGRGSERGVVEDRRHGRATVAPVALREAAMTVERPPDPELIGDREIPSALDVHPGL
jgi:hypothetical protein